MLTVDLHPYQTPPVEMLLERESLLLAMEMGLGKTITVLSAAEHLLGEGTVTTVLIAAPSGLLTQWAESIAANTDVTSKLIKVKGELITVPQEQWCVIVDGTPAKKRAALERIEADPPQYIVASYDTVADNLRMLRRISQMAIIDEVTALKGFKAARAKSLRKLRTRYRVGLSGAPVENHRPEEAYGIMAWIDPTLFGSFQIFESAYIRRDHAGRPVRYVNLDVLHRKLSVAMYRKRATDADVADYMPGVDREVWAVNLDDNTRVVYGRIMQDLEAELHALSSTGQWDAEAYYSGSDSSGVGAGRVAAVHQVALMLLDHPDLVRQSARSFAAEVSSAKKSGSAYAAALVDSGCLDDLVATPKLDVLHTKVTAVLRSAVSNKVIIVAKYRGMQDLIAARFDDVQNVRYHGGLSPADKAAAVSRFETDPSVRLMIMSHAGVYGVDLPAGTHLVNYSPPRSAGQRGQLEARHVRVSSTHDRVSVIHLYAVGTVEERMYDLLALKARVASAVTDGQGTDDGSMTARVTSLTRYVADERTLAA